MELAIRAICIAIGYVFGLFQTSYLLGKLKHEDIRDFGSGNAGTTNAMRVLGKKAGILTFLGDCIKAVLCLLLVKLLLIPYFPDLKLILELYAGFGVVLGHNYPFYMGFKGGKGIAATGGVIIGLADPKLFAVSFVIFFGVTLISKYVSLGSICMIAGFFIQIVVYGQLGILSGVDTKGVTNAHLIEAYAIAFVIAAFAFVRHRGNIMRLLNGTERRIGQKKKEEEK